MRFENHVAIVTGGGGGIGFGIAQGLIEEGARVVIVGRRENVLQEAVAVLGPAAGYIAGDISNPAHAQHMVDETLNRYGRLDMLVNNAAIRLLERPIGQQPLEDIDLLIDVNLRGSILITNAAVPHLLNSPAPAILNISSASGRSPAAFTGVYGATKIALIHLTRVWAIELAPKVRVNCLCPGPTHTPAFEQVRAIFPPLEEVAAADTLLGRVSDVSDVVPACLMLLDSQDGAYITGAVLDVDGGYQIIGRQRG